MILVFLVAVGVLTYAQFRALAAPPALPRHLVAWAAAALAFTGMGLLYTRSFLASVARNETLVLVALTAGLGLLLGGWYARTVRRRGASPRPWVLALIHAVVIYLGMVLGAVVWFGSGMSGVR